MTDYSTNAEPEQDILEQVAGMIDENFRSAQDAYDEHLAKQVVSAELVTKVADLLFDLEGQARQAGTNVLRTLIGYCSAAEREKTTTALHKLFPRHNELVRFLASCPPPSDSRRFQRLTLSQVMEMKPKEWLVDQVFGRGDLLTEYGAPGSGKTFVGLDLAFAACLGRPFAGRFEVLRPLTVAYAAGEGGSGLAQRLQAAAEYFGVDDTPNLHIYMTAPQLYDSKDPCNAAKFVEEYAAAQADGDVKPLDLLILDTLHSVTAGADENSSQHMGEVLRQAKAIAERLGCAVCLIHHTNKNGTAERGSSALRGAMDCMIEVKEVGNGRVMSCEKLKDGETWKPQTFDLIAKGNSVRVEWGTVGSTGKNDATPAKLMAVLRDNAGMHFTAKSLAEAVGVSPGTCFVALNRLTEKGEVNRELEDKSKPSSTRNPWVYFVTE